ncbi:MAG TPA: hypothetical protein VLY63_24255 [Anaerolineae bacterium]|nr:hypothetical protein [Anaerolineae bacterium]
MGRKGNAVGRMVLIVAGLSGVLWLSSRPSPPCPVLGNSSSAASPVGELVPRAFFPLVIHPGSPPEPELTIYDKYGTEQNWDWLVSNFGAVTLDRGTGVASVRVLREVEGPSTLVVWVENADGDPIENVPVVFYWAGAPLLPPEQQACGLDRGIVGLTKSTGETGIGMGGGAYYFPPAGGPHVVWVAAEGTDCLGGLGMLGGTNHIHLDSVWRLP